MPTILDEILKEDARLTELRKYERNLAAKKVMLSRQPLVSVRRDLRSNLAQNMPKKLVPKNVGNYDQVVWPYEMQFEFNYMEGNNLVIRANEKKESTTQVSKDGVFLVTEFFLEAGEEIDGLPISIGRGMPLQVTLRDRQSSRQMNDEPIQIQHLGGRGEGSKLPVPYLLMENSRFTLELSSWLSSDLSIPDMNQYVDSVLDIGKIVIVARGWRCRSEDSSLLLETMYL